ncbi:MAG: phage portal protein, partial [Pseudomonadales bacterium]|nr:phage portal protein [Pseudomonadales bacterium]
MPRPPIQLDKTDHTRPFAEGFGPFQDVADAARQKATSLGTGFDIGTWIRQLRLGGEDDLTQAWAQSWIVYACVRVRAEAVESVPFCLWDRPKSEPDREKITSHRVLDLIERPNAHMDAADLRYFTQGYRDLCGEAFVLFGVQEDGDGGRFRAANPNEFPNVLLPVPGWALTLYRRSNSLSYHKVAYTFDGDGGTVEFEPHAFGLLRNPHLYEWWRGFGPGEAISRIASRMFQQERYDDALLRNGGAPSLILSTEKSQTPQQVREHQKLIRDRVTSNRARNQPLVLTGGLKVEPYGYAPKDMEHGEMRKWDRDAIMAAFGVTKPLLGITDDVIRANADAALEVFWRHTMSNELARAQRQWQRQVVEPLTERSAATRRVQVWIGFDTSGVAALQESMDEQIARAVALHESLGIPVPEAAREAGLQLDDETVAALEAKLEADAESAAALQGAMAAAQADDDFEDDEAPNDAPDAEQRAVAASIVASVLQGGTRRALAADAIVRLPGFTGGAVERILATAPAGSLVAPDGDRFAEMEQLEAATEIVRRGLLVRSSEEQRRNRATEHDEWLRGWEGKIAKAYSGPARDYVLATRKAVRAYAERELSYTPEATRAFDEVAFRALLAEIMPGTGDFAEKFGLRM